MYCRYFKRPLDIFLSLFGIVLLSPLFVLIALLVRVKLGYPTIFRQPRPGMGEKVFTMFKFRTMTDDRDEQGCPLPDEVRLKPFGRMLRSTSLDELPELFNILRGDMSLVGPRPLLVRYLPYYTDAERTRHAVRPGLSGLAQVSGRNNLDWKTKLALDVEYVHKIGLLLDLKILCLTLMKVWKREGIVGEGGEGPVYLDYERRGAIDDPRARP